MSDLAKPRLTLSDVVDLELQLGRDRESDPVEIRRRDAEIARRIDARRLSGPPLFMAWLTELRQREQQPPEGSAGRRLQRLLDCVGLALFVLGALLGGSAVAAWLAHGDGRPVNVIFFFSAIIGLQMPLLMLWVAAALPTAWLKKLPGAETLQWILRAIAQLPPRIITWVAAHLSGQVRDLVARVRGEMARWGWVYGRLRMWILIRLTQVFALAFNVGAVVTFVAVSYGSDPAFGWKSTMLTPEQLHGVTRVVAAPWALIPASWAATPTLEDLRLTRYSSLNAVYASSKPLETWARWWPFLLASLLCYGVLPRLLTFWIAHGQVRRSLASVRLDHSEFQRLAERLTRPQVDTQATAPEESGGEGRGGSGRLPPALADVAAAMAARPLPGGACALLVWAGVDLAPEQAQHLAAQRLDAPVLGVHPVGGLDPALDSKAVVAVARDASVRQVALLVEAWEPPVGDYLDFIQSLRSQLGTGRAIRVLLYDRDPAGHAVAARPAAARIWESRLSALGDPWLRVDSLLEGRPAPRRGEDPR